MVNRSEEKTSITKLKLHVLFSFLCKYVDNILIIALNLTNILTLLL